MAKRKPTPWDITIDVEPLYEDDDMEQLLDHHTITLRVPTPEELPTATTLDETTSAYRWTGGVLARVGMMLHDDVDDTTYGHGCPRTDRCGLSSKPIDMAWMLESCDGPWLMVTIPATCDLDEWTERVKYCLDQVLEQEQWQPTEGDLAAWSR